MFGRSGRIHVHINERLNNKNFFICLGSWFLAPLRCLSTYIYIFLDASLTALQSSSFVGCFFLFFRYICFSPKLHFNAKSLLFFASSLSPRVAAQPTPSPCCQLKPYDRKVYLNMYLFIPLNIQVHTNINTYIHMLTYIYLYVESCNSCMHFYLCWLALKLPDWLRFYCFQPSGFPLPICYLLIFCLVSFISVFLCFMAMENFLKISFPVSVNSTACRFYSTNSALCIYIQLFILWKYVCTYKGKYINTIAKM